MKDETKHVKAETSKMIQKMSSMVGDLRRENQELKEQKNTPDQ